MLKVVFYNLTIIALMSTREYHFYIQEVKEKGKMGNKVKEFVKRGKGKILFPKVL